MLDDSPRFKMIELDETSSTNTFLQGYRPLRPVDVTLVTAEHQTAGRGQRGNHWESEAGRNLLFSLLLCPESLPATHLFTLSEAIALSIREAVCQALTHPHFTLPAPAPAPQAAPPQVMPGDEKVPHPTVTVKWPNDIYVGDCKIGGILIENELRGMNIGRAIIGCGININQTDFAFPQAAMDEAAGGNRPPQPMPVSLRQLTGCDTERRFILEAIVEGFIRRYQAILTDEEAGTRIHAEYLGALYRRTGFHRFQEPGNGDAAPAEFLAEIADVEPKGHLLLRDREGQLRRYAFKEVRFL